MYAIYKKKIVVKEFKKIQTLLLDIAFCLSNTYLSLDNLLVQIVICETKRFLDFFQSKILI